jgi:uncharacterized membrane protein
MNRPKIIIKKNNIDKAIEILTFTLILISALIIGIFYGQLPEKLPIYFNWPSKDENGFGTKDLLWTNPIICGIIGIALYKLNQYPWIFNYPIKINEKNAEYNYKMATLMLRILGLLIGITGILMTLTSILNGLGNNTDFDKYLYPFLSIVYIGLPIIYLIKILLKKTMHRL